MAKKSQTSAEEVKNSKCPVTREQFLQAAKPLMVAVGDRQLVGTVKEFSTGSFGWHAMDKIVVMVGDVPVKVQVNVNLIAVGSKS